MPGLGAAGWKSSTLWVPLQKGLLGGCILPAYEQAELHCLSPILTSAFSYLVLLPAFSALPSSHVLTSFWASSCWKLRSYEYGIPLPCFCCFCCRLCWAGHGSLFYACRHLRSQSRGGALPACLNLRGVLSISFISLQNMGSCISHTAMPAGILLY